MERSLRLRPFFLLFALCLFTAALDSVAGTLWQGEYLFFAVSFLILLIALRYKVKWNWVTAVLWAGLILKVLYVLYTPVWARQHDVVDFGAGEGHAAYIEYIFSHNSLPDFDPRTVWAFFQPPLHHIIAAVWMKINGRLGFDYRQMQENVQVLTLFYTGASVLFSYFIFKAMGLKEKGLLTATAIIAFHPVLTLLSGSINNDVLSLMFQLAAVYFTLCWYEKSSFGTILLIALSVGCSMMAKLSGGAVAPAIAVVFLMKLVQERERFLRYIGQFAAFGVVCVPLALWFPVKNMLRFDMPLNYTPAVGEAVGDYSFLQRMFDVRMHSVYPAMINNGDAYDEYNVPLQLLKSSLFGEYNYGSELPLITPFAVLLFISALLLVALAVFATIYCLVRRDETFPLTLRLFWGVYYVTLLFVCFQFAFSMPYFSSQDFRYIVPALIINACFLGRFLEQNPQWRQFRLAAVSGTVCFCASSAAVYYLLGFVPKG